MCRHFYSKLVSPEPKCYIFVDLVIVLLKKILQKHNCKVSDSIHGHSYSFFCFILFFVFFSSFLSFLTKEYSEFGNQHLKQLFSHIMKFN